METSLAWYEEDGWEEVKVVLCYEWLRLKLECSLLLYLPVLWPSGVTSLWWLCAEAAKHPRALPHAIEAFAALITSCGPKNTSEPCRLCCHSVAAEGKWLYYFSSIEYGCVFQCGSPPDLWTNTRRDVDSIGADHNVTLASQGI